MILYVNGDSHSAAAEAVNPFGWACDDANYFYLGTAPHPNNLAVSWGRLLSDAMKMGLHNDSQSGGSNDRIIRTSRDWLAARKDPAQNVFVVVSWTTWERQEWNDHGTWWQVGASGTDSVPSYLVERYKNFVTDIDWQQCMENCHAKIWQWHQELLDQGIRHLFFNGNNDFNRIPKSQRHKWGPSYISPYDAHMTYSQWLLDHGFETVAPNSWHFGREAHAAWGRFVLQYVIDNQIIS